MVEHLTLDNYEEKMSSKQPMIIDFFADWCGPCQMMAPVFSTLGKEFSGKMDFLKVDTQTEEGLAMKFGIRGLPTLVVLKDGKEVDRIVGYHDEDALREKLSSYVQ